MQKNNSFDKVKNILIVGVGGQGTLLASKILGQVGLLAGLDAKQSEVHGMAQRGGSVVSHVRLGKQVHSPLIEKGQADIILSFEKLEALRWADYLKPGGVIIVNDQQISPVTVIIGAAEYPSDAKIFASLESADIKVVRVDGLNLATSLGEARAVNVILLGVAAKILGFEKKIWEQAIEDSISAEAAKVNLKAFSVGWDM